jgi:hypothetical protein
MEKTAVEWLEQHIKELETKLFNFEVSPLESPTIREGLYKQAKQMEKEQMEGMWENGKEQYWRLPHAVRNKLPLPTFKSYYSETYNNGK